jgi:6-phosphogluconolactonase
LSPESRWELLTFADAASLAHHAAEAWLEELAGTPARGAPYCVALSGGRIARQFLSAVAEQAKRAGVSFDSVHFFWGDERCVLPTDPESNFGLASELLIQPMGIPDAQIHRIRGELPPGIAASEAEVELRRLAPGGAGGQPQLDMIFLGMGEDGHVASLFPGETEGLVSSKAVFRAVVAAKAPPRRITIGYPTIAAARQVWVLASGPGKEAALRQSLALGDQVIPLGRVLGLRRSTTIFADIRVQESPQK